jgi:M6 family metalloprotease-like protein
MGIACGFGLALLGAASAVTLDDFGYNRRRVNGLEARGSRPLLVILANYAGHARQFPTNIANLADEYVFSLADTQSVSGYFFENSNKRFSWSRAGLIGPVEFSSVEAADGNDPRILATVVLAAMRSGQFDFARYDGNGDGIVTSGELGILIISNKGGDGQWGVMRWANLDGVNAPYDLRAAGVSVALRVTVSAAEHTSSFTTKAHELSHQLGTLDLYGSGGLNSDLTLMDATIEGRIPDQKTYHLDPWHKLQLGWVEPRILSLRSGGVTLLPAPQKLQADGPVILYDPERGEGEFFMLEFRTRERPNGGVYDTGVAGTGLCVWHIKQDSNKNPVPIPNVTGHAVVHRGSPDFDLGGNFVWASGASTPNLAWLDGTQLPSRLMVRPFDLSAGTISVEWLWEELVWVKFDYSGFEFGTFDFPFNTLAEGMNDVAWGGVLKLKSGSSSERGTFTKRMDLHAYGGPVTIGR